MAVAAANQQLRTVQVNFADDPVEKRQDYYREVIQRSLGAVLPDQRSPFLDALALSFPVFPQTPFSDAGGGNEKGGVRMELLAKELCEQIPYLDDEEQAALASQLATAGLPQPGAQATKAPGDEMMDLPASIRDTLAALLARFQIEHLDIVRSVKLLVLLIQYFSAVHAAASDTLAGLAPAASDTMAKDLAPSMNAYISGDRSVSAVALKKRLESAQAVTTHLLTEAGALSPDKVQEHLDGFLLALTST